MTNPYGYPPPPQQPVYVVRPTSTWAVVSLVVGILGAVGGWCLFAIPCIVAVLAGHFALGETKDGTIGGRGMAVAGLILGYVFGVPWGIFATMAVTGGAISGIGAMPPWLGWTVGILAILGTLGGITWWGLRRR